MPKDTLYILDEDKVWLTNRINELEQHIQALGPDFYDVFNQSSETWHDNAPFDALRDKQAILFAEYSNLKAIRHQEALSLPKSQPNTVAIGAVVTLDTGSKYCIAGDWTPRAGKIEQDFIIISSKTPLASELIGKKTGEATRFGTIKTIE